MTTAFQPAGRKASCAKGCHRKASRRASCHHRLCIPQCARSMPGTKVPLLPSPAFDLCSVPREFTQRTTLCCFPLLPLAGTPGSTEPGLQKERCCSTKRSGTACRPPDSHCCSQPAARLLLLLHARAAAGSAEPRRAQADIFLLRETKKERYAVQPSLRETRLPRDAAQGFLLLTHCAERGDTIWGFAGGRQRAGLPQAALLLTGCTDSPAQSTSRE